MTSSKFVMGLFALFVALFSLGRGLSEEEFYRLTKLKKALGRTHGILCFFLTDVALPLVVGIMYLSKSVADSGGLYMVP
ncbi:MAG: hypothetical protein AB7F20_07925 [Geoalkalibacter sp.]|jgi:hypothetical protein|uniref:hypothetical protein n=1 Tax=Geoalkalibacter sp. TaxID=3041440 RepID=UPI002A9D7477|nr:hypothetical protein [Thermodesulfobacteriota bacterium]